MAAGSEEEERERERYHSARRERNTSIEATAAVNNRYDFCRSTQWST